MMKVFTKNNKKGVTLVESVIAVLILGIFTIGVITLLTAGGTKILQISHEAGVNSELTQKIDYLISSVSNGSSDFVTVTPGENESEATCSLNVDNICSKLGFAKNDINVSTAYYVGSDNYVKNVRGWYITIKYQGAAVTTFLSNSEGAFDTK